MMRRLLVYAVVLAAVAGYLGWRRAPADLVVVLAADGGLQFEQAVLSPAELTALLRTRMARAPQPTVRLQVDPRAPVTAMIPVIDAVHASGAANLHVATLE